MNQYFVYLIKSQNRLIIIKNEIIDNDYLLLMNNQGGNDTYLLTLCKVFCIGYIAGTKVSKIPINSISEFQ